MDSEAQRITERYARRVNDDRYNPLLPYVYMGSHERRRRIAQLLSAQFGADVGRLRVLEVGCGSGSNLLELVGLGLSPENLTGNDLLAERVARARRRLPADVRLLAGDAMELPLERGGFDMVYQSTVFSSILDAEFRQRLAARMWDWIRPGGAVLWYDIAVNNPSNQDIRGVPTREVRRLFPAGVVRSHRVTLAPPIGRAITRVHPSLYSLFNALPLLRTHRLCLIQKP